MLMYQALWQLAKPLVKLYFHKRGKKDPQYNSHLEQRFLGKYQDLSSSFLKLCQAKGSLHFHAASLGEVNLIKPFIIELLTNKELAFESPVAVVVTTNTPTGRKAALELEHKFIDQLAVVYTPLEYTHAIDNFIQTFKPRASYFVETEIWPLFITKLAQHHQVNLLNARVNATKVKKYSKGVMLNSIKKFSAIIAQDQTNALRFYNILHHNKQVVIDANFQLENYGKYCQAVKEQSRVEYFAFKQKKPALYIGNNLKFCKTQAKQKLYQLQKASWLDFKITQQSKAGILLTSTYPNEVELLLTSLEQTLKQAYLILAPRHPENFQAIEQLLVNQQISYLKLSTVLEKFNVLWQQLESSCAKSSSVYDHSEQAEIKEILAKLWQLLSLENKVLVVDTIGDLSKFYQLVDLVIIGGTFNQIGGHDLIEAVASKNFVLLGSNYKNQVGVAEPLLALQAIKEISLNVKDQSENKLKYLAELTQVLDDFTQYFATNEQSFLQLHRVDSNKNDLSKTDYYLAAIDRSYNYYLQQQNALVNHLYLCEFIRDDK
ncbi:3-deoxy-D-manno-octulosonic acid transferase [Psittacicella hinzii]|uniref:3-deoxy-D-manno-octulosonic acid transferase n=1 Tax=Psittacicella hinzii TaxID=2028575 RepID=A0A3A1Y981_9GAMM|nr:glycosyltransferase N-terminal domain-containing protein [Psittacicella hinzii]RIY34742.1 hypothetical protein CKF58_07740 [Psittacicella hinzii]